MVSQTSLCSVRKKQSGTLRLHADKSHPAGGTGRGLRFSSMATNVNVPSVTFCSASSVRLRRQASTRIVNDVWPIRKMHCIKTDFIPDKDRLMKNYAIDRHSDTAAARTTHGCVTPG